MLATFEMFDKDRDGMISVKEVKAVVNAIGDTPNTEHIEAMFRQVDLDGKPIVESPFATEAELLGRRDITS